MLSKAMGIFWEDFQYSRGFYSKYHYSKQLHVHIALTDGISYTLFYLETLYTSDLRQDQGVREVIVKASVLTIVRMNF